MKKIILAAITFTCIHLIAYSQCPGQIEVDINITPDNYPTETSWELRLAPPLNTLIAQGTTNDTTFCYNAGSCMVFTIFDSYGDGICCGYGNGSYSVTINGVLQAAGGQFNNQESTYMNCPPGVSCNSAFPVNTGSFTAPVADTWYEFTPDSTGMYEVTTCGNTCDTKIWVYDHCMGLVWDNTNIGTTFYNDDNQTCGYQAVVTGVFDANTTYYIRIGQYNTSCGNNPITWSLNFLGPVLGCMDPQSCTFNPLATVDDGSCLYYPDTNCPGPDLLIVESEITNSLYFDTENVQATDCRIDEGCLNGYGLRDILRFTTHIKNIGEADYYIGVPSLSNPQFTNNNCHGHWHYEGYAYYALYDNLGNEIPIGYKNGFCVLDLECSGGGTAQYGCGNMGISHGCGDIYGAGLDCQFIDLTNVDTGYYQLVVRVNWDQSPDFLGRYEETYDNNVAHACIHFTRDVNGIPDFTLEQNCPVIYDCLGDPFGTAVLDCEGNCNGTAVRGDVDDNNTLTQNDAVTYNSGLLDNSLPEVTCTDMNADGEWTVFDAALINNCSLNGPSNTNDPCHFPHGIDNVIDTVTLSIANVDFANHYVDIAIKNPFFKTIAYQFEMSGITIQSVANLVSPLEYNITPEYLSGGNEIIGISYQQMLISTNASPDALCRIYYSSITDSVICISNIVDIVNQNYEASLGVIGGNCVAVPSAAIEENGSAIAFSVFPNPAEDMVNVSMGFLKAEDAQLTITDALGKIVLVQNYKSMLNQTVQLDLSTLSGGVYNITLQTNSDRLTKRIVVK